MTKSDTTTPFVPCCLYSTCYR